MKSNAPIFPAMPDRYQVSVAKESAGFSAAHFLTLPGHMCERLHGHNYRVAVTVEGPLDPATGFLADFAVLKRGLRQLIEPLDHRLLVPTANGALTVREVGDQLAIDYTRRDWLVVPLAHTARLPVAHTTAEVLAGHFGETLWTMLQGEGVAVVRMTVTVEESAGQSAGFTRES